MAMISEQQSQEENKMINMILDDTNERMTKTIPKERIIQNKSPASGVSNDIVRFYFIGTILRNILRSQTGRHLPPTHP